MAEKRYFDKVKTTVDESTFLINDENFKLPDRGDYYHTAVDSPYIKMVDEAIREVTDGDENKASFYIEKPYVTQLGTHDLEGVFFIKARPDISEEADNNGYFDGDTLYFPKSSIQADADTISRITNSLDTALEDLSRASRSEAGHSASSFNDVGLRFLGLDTPETPKYSTEFVELDKEERIAIPYKEAMTRNNRLYLFNRGHDYRDDEMIQFIKVGETWRAYDVKGEANDRGHTKLRVFQKEGESDPRKLAAGLKAKNLVKKLIEKAGGDVYFMIDRTSLNRESGDYPTRFGRNAYSSGVIDRLLYWYQQVEEYNPYRLAGYSQWGQDAYGRYLGTPYVKIKDENGERWINMAKYIIAEVPEAEVLPDYTGSPLFENNAGMASNVFRLHTYDFTNRVLADASSILADKLDDRRRIQRDIFNRDFDALKDWTVTIGDTTLFVPPTSIRSIVNTTNERMPLIRAKGSLTKGALKEERFIEMTLYFNDERGINGYEYDTKLPNGKDVTYYMNGLRALIAQFKFTPYLPIDSHYINEILNIDAVTLANFQISTVPDYPKCIAATLTLQEFDFIQYMPELPASLDESDEYRNIFAGTINYEMMRWYYQRSIRLGESLRDVDVNSREYLEKTEGHKTALIPMNFESPQLRFLIANEEHLKKMLQVKMDMIRSPFAKIVLSDLEKEVAKDISLVYKNLADTLGSDTFQSQLKAINELTEDTRNTQNKKLTVIHSGDLVEDKLKNMTFKQYTETHDNGELVYEEFGDVDNDLFINIASTLREGLLQTNNDMGRNLLTGGRLAYREEKISRTVKSSTPARTKLTPPKGYLKGKVMIGVEFDVNLDYLTNPDQINDLRREASLETQLQMDDVFKEKKLFIPIYGSFERDNTVPTMQYTILRDDANFKFDTMYPDIQFIAYCHSTAVALGYADNKTMNEDAHSIKQQADRDTVNSISYDEYDAGDIRIKNLSCSFGNVFTQIGLNGSSGYASQYVGGQDTVIEIGIETTDAYAVGMLNALPRIATQYARDYRLVLPASPLKLDSEITKLLGVNETVIEKVEVDTVPNQPGLYQVSIRLIAMDRTLRNREGLKKINDFALSGSNTTEEKSERAFQTYFELNDVLSQAELYPDLELPKLEEFEDAGFAFIRHAFEDRTYPDPDFYFVYGHVLQSQIFRETVENFSNEDMDQTTWRDSEGGEVVTKTQKDLGVTVESLNDVAQEYEDSAELIDEAALTMEDEKSLLKSNFDVINVLRASDAVSSWDISEDIKSIFLEPSYLSLLEYHEKLKDIPSSTKAETDSSVGTWIYEATEPARKASKAIESYLAKKPSNPDKQKKVWGSTYYTVHNPVNKDAADSKVDELLKNKEIENIFELLDINIDRKFKKALRNIVWAAACAATSEKEYTNKKGEAGWRPNVNFVGLKISSSQDNSGMDTINTEEELVKQGVEFGPYRIKMYSKDEIRNITGQSISKDIFGGVKDATSINTSYFLIDPYYRSTKATLEEIEEYKRGNVDSVQFATEAFFRVLLFWLKRMIDDHILPNMSLDVLSTEFETEISNVLTTNRGISKEAVEANKEAAAEAKELVRYMEFLSKSERAVDGGKVFAAAVMALTNSDSFYEPMKERRYDMLNGMVESAMSVSGDYSPTDMDYILLRKFLLALVGVGEIKRDTDVGTKGDNPITDFKKALNGKKYIEAAEDPNQYIKHSFYDMITTDMRGRMARAFPTFYAVFLDTGREIGLWKLHDNFYNINSISEIQVSKSRKNPADTCKITVSNLFHTLTTDDEDSNMNHEYDWRDVFTSIFNPRSYFLKEEAKRMKQQPLDRARLTPGTRIHVRMGYGSNAATLPVAFNGTIAEVGTGDAVEIIAQGDGIELMNPIMDNTQAHDYENIDTAPILRGIQNAFTSASTPKQILDSFLTAEGFFRKTAREWTNGYYFNDHPLGITHFGDPRYDLVFSEGESTQNIFEAMNKPKWADIGSVISEEWSMKEVPKFTMDVYGKTFWDVLNICGSATPDFVVGIAPFGFRSTIFHGHPRYYYAYEYFKDDANNILEKRKPFQQYHVYTSYSDIIKNNIRANSRDVKTSATGVYSRKGFAYTESQKKVGPLWVDFDIYPEHQKSMVYDTQLLNKGVPILGGLMPFMNTIIDNIDNGEGVVQGGKEIAWRMTAHALKQSVMDMYQGELIVTGDPSVKPHDRMFIHDSYENMSGAALVEGCVHNFSAEHGFTTTIYPDCIAAVDDRHELAVQSTARMVVGRAVTSTLAVMAPSLIFGKTFTPLLSIAAGRASKLAASGIKVLANGGAAATAAKLTASAKAAKGIFAGLTVGKATAAGGAVVATGGAALIPLAALGLEIAVIQTISKAASTAFTRRMASKQVLQIFPLMKDQKVLTSGLNGSTGLVHGSPTFNSPSTLKSLYAKLDTNSNGFSGATNFVINLLTTDEMQNIAARYARGSAYIRQDDSNVDSQESINSSFDYVPSVTRKQAGYKRLLLTPRMNPQEKGFNQKLERLFDQDAFLDTNAIELQPRITNETVYVKHDEKLKEAMGSGMLQTAWDAPLPENTYEFKEFNIHGKPEQIRTIVVQHRNKKLYDIPFLRSDALDVLREIMVKVSYLLPDHDPTKDKTTEDFIMLHSALKVGDNETFSSLGYAFIVEAFGDKRKTLLLDAINAINKEVKELYNDGDLPNEKLFEWSLDANEKGEKTIALITVLPPA